MSVASYTPRDVDFEVIREDWTRYRLTTDKTLLRLRITLAKIIQTGVGETGIPDFGVATQNCLSAMVPQELLKKEGEVPVFEGPIRPEDVKEGLEMDYELEGTPKWQEYKMVEGWVLLLKPEVGRVVRTKCYARMGRTGLLEPIYWVNIQPFYRVKRT